MKLAMAAEKGEVEDESEACVKTPEKDAISMAIGDVGRYQITRLFIILLVTAPGLAHIFAGIFATVKTDFWCEDGPLNNDTRNECRDDCSSYSFDTSSWTRTLNSDYQLVCSRKPLLCEYVHEGRDI